MTSRDFTGPRGFLVNYPEDVVYLIDGRPITKIDILNAKRKKQARILANKRAVFGPVVKPCFVWTFYNTGWVYTGWWLYIQTLHKYWQVDVHRNHTDLAFKIMKMFPLGILPLAENFTIWKEAFAKAYPYPTRKRPKDNGLVIAKATIENGRLLDVNPIS